MRPKRTTLQYFKTKKKRSNNITLCASLPVESHDFIRIYTQHQNKNTILIFFYQVNEPWTKCRTKNTQSKNHARTYTHTQ